MPGNTSCQPNHLQTIDLEQLGNLCSNDFRKIVHIHKKNTTKGYKRFKIARYFTAGTYITLNIIKQISFLQSKAPHKAMLITISWGCAISTFSERQFLKKSFVWMIQHPMLPRFGSSLKRKGNSMVSIPQQNAKKEKQQLTP